MADATGSTALLAWIQAFGSLSRVPQKVSDLSDGLVFGEVLKLIDPKWFGGLKLEKGDNWVIKFNNLKKLFKQLSSYFEEALYQNPNNLDAVNLTAIAKESDPAEIAKLGFLVVAAAVQCEANQDYIMQIRSLDEASQHSIMVAIEKIMARLNGEDAPAPADRSSMDKPRAAEAEDGAATKALQDKLTRVQGQYEEVLTKVGQLQAELKDAHEKLANPAASAKSEVVFKAEMDALKRKLDISEAKRHEAEGLLSEEQELVQSLKRKLDDTAKKAQEASSLKDQVDELRQVSDKLAKAEATIEKYRKRGDEANELRQKLKLLEDENRVLQERSGHVEDEYRKVADSSSLAVNFKDELLKLEQAKSRLTSELDSLREQFAVTEERALKLDELCNRQRDQIHALETQVRELELGGNLPQDNEPRGLPSDAIPDSQLRDELEKERRASAAKDEKLMDLQRALKKAKDYILNQNEQLKQLSEAKTNQLDDGPVEETITTMQNDLSRKQSELDQTKQELREIKAAARREQKLLLTAFYELGLQLQKRNLVGPGAGAASPTWLNTHRQAIDARYRK